MSRSGEIRRLIIDGYSLLFRESSATRQRGQSLSHARERLIRRIDRVAAALAQEVVIVFDGQVANREEIAAGRLSLIFAPAGRTADAVIEQMVHADPDPTSVCVVSSDRLELVTVSAANAMAMSCTTFLEWLERVESGINQAHTARRPPPRFTIGDVFPSA
ncbi:MAG: NYN domain-containing protein [Kiritimatiellae bacterium]|nr:NYN domain-containing protein [Kiritimatiellia bacterium]MDW8457572.1 NYN domain-containing protein [Verrucomicrobiota bacterium]